MKQHTVAGVRRLPGPTASRAARDNDVREDRAFALLAFAGLAVATAVASIGPLSDPDAWWNLRVGQ